MLVLREKPKLRGISHLIATLASIAGAACLIAAAPTDRARLAGAVYGLSLAAMFGISALYHIPTWDAHSRQWLRRLDHAAIFLFLGGSYTPFCLLTLPPEVGNRLLCMAWIGTACGLLQSLLWIRAPKIVSASLYMALGWMVLPYVPDLVAAIGARRMLMVFWGGVCYTVGGLVYAIRRPDPMPTIFGYHEVFHALVIAGCALQYQVVLEVVRGL
jgi:hemolysin III